jgi:hypothetical protein
MGEEKLIHPVTGLAALGVLPSGRIVWPVLGGSGEGDPEPEPDDPDNDPAPDPDPEPDPEPEPDPKDDLVSRAELRKAAKARDDAKKALRDLRAEVADLKRAGEDETARATREAAEAAAAAAEKKYKPIVIKTTARAELVAAGVKSGKEARLIKLLDLDDIDIDDDGEVTGLTEQVDALKEEWPELFAQPEEKPREQRRGSRAADGADKKPPPKKELTPSERQAALLLGTGG